MEPLMDSTHIIIIALSIYLLTRIHALGALRKRIAVERKERAELWLNFNTLQEKIQNLDEFYEEKNLTKFKNWCSSKEKEIRADAINRSRNVMRGQATEHLAPYMMSNDLNPKDFRFMGNPIDYIVFSGASDVTDGVADTINKVVFIDIKTNKSKLNKVQRRVRDAINEGRVEFLIYNPDKE